MTTRGARTNSGPAGRPIAGDRVFGSRAPAATPARTATRPAGGSPMNWHGIHRIITVQALASLVSALPGSLGLVARTSSEIESNLFPLLLDVCAEGICLFGDEHFEPPGRSLRPSARPVRFAAPTVAGTLMWVFRTPERRTGGSTGTASMTASDPFAIAWLLADGFLQEASRQDSELTPLKPVHAGLATGAPDVG